MLFFFICVIVSLFLLSHDLSRPKATQGWDLMEWLSVERWRTSCLFLFKKNNKFLLNCLFNFYSSNIQSYLVRFLMLDLNSNAPDKLTFDSDFISLQYFLYKTMQITIVFFFFMKIIVPAKKIMTVFFVFCFYIT